MPKSFAVQPFWAGSDYNALANLIQMTEQYPHTAYNGKCVGYITYSSYTKPQSNQYYRRYYKNNCNGGQVFLIKVMNRHAFFFLYTTSLCFYSLYISLYWKINIILLINSFERRHHLKTAALCGKINEMTFFGVFV